MPPPPAVTCLSLMDGVSRSAFFKCLCVFDIQKEKSDLFCLDKRAYVCVYACEHLCVQILVCEHVCVDSESS